MNDKFKIYLSITFIGAVIVTVLMFITFPFFEKITANSEKIIEKKKDIAYMNSEMGNLEKFANTYESLEVDLERLNETTVDPGDPIDFIEFFEHIADASDLYMNIDSISDEPKRLDSFSRSGIKLNATVEGSFVELLRFLKAIESSHYLSAIDDLTISITEAGGIRSSLVIKIITDEG